jgi:uncharacterized membrane protein
MKANQNGSSSGSSEIDNHKVTLTQLQIGILAQDRDVQAQLSDLTEQADMETPEGRLAFLQEGVLSVLRSPENWSHIHGKSQTVNNREAAAQQFGELSLQVRSKFSEETLVNARGKVRKQDADSSAAEDPGSYIVVTLLVGTAHDQPLFDKLYTLEDLKTALEILGSLSTDYLLILELLWSPQESGVSLSQDELISDYPELMPL